MNQNATSFDFSQLAAAAKKAAETISRMNGSGDVDYQPVAEVGNLLRPLISDECRRLRALNAVEVEKLLLAARQTGVKMNSTERLRSFLGEIVGTTRNIAKIKDEKVLGRTHTFLVHLAG